MKPRHVLALGLGPYIFASILSSDRGAVSTMRAPSGQKASRSGETMERIEADRRTGDEIAATQGDEVRGPRPSPDEMNGHGWLASSGNGLS